MCKWKICFANNMISAKKFVEILRILRIINMCKFNKQLNKKERNRYKLINLEGIHGFWESDLILPIFLWIFWEWHYIIFSSIKNRNGNHQFMKLTSSFTQLVSAFSNWHIHKLKAFLHFFNTVFFKKKKNAQLTFMKHCSR